MGETVPSEPETRRLLQGWDQSSLCRVILHDCGVTKSIISYYVIKH